MIDRIHPELRPLVPALPRVDIAEPAAWISANELDPLRDEAIEYALRLLRAGVPVELHHRPGTFHGSNGFAGFSVSDRTREDMHLGLKTALAEPD